MLVLLNISIWLIGAAVNLLVSRQKRSAGRVVEVLLLWALIVVGLQAILASYSHLLNGPAIARSIGWPPGNPFQAEVGFANLGLGLLGLMCIWRRGVFWLATIVMATVFYWGAAYVHIDQILRFQNYAPNNAGSILYIDIFTPIILISLYVIHKAIESRQEKVRPKHLLRAA